MMNQRRVWIFIFLVAAISSPLAQADVIVEPYFVDDPFFFGISGTNPGDQFADLNAFDSSPSFTGQVEIFNPNTIFAGSGDVVFTAQTGAAAGSRTRLDFDMGADMDQSTLNNSSLVDSSITFSGLRTDLDPDSFVFRFTATLFDGTEVNTLTDLNITVNNGVSAFSDLDGGLFELALDSTGSPMSVVFASATSSPIRSLSLRSIQPDLGGNLLLVSGNRTINFSNVPEPGNFAFTFLIVLSIFGPRRRTALIG